MKGLFFFCLLIFCSLCATPPKLLMLGGGVFDCDRKHPIAQYQIEYRSDYDIFECDWLFIRPLCGLMGTQKGALYAFGGIAFDFLLGSHVAITPSFAPGLYYDGGGKKLGFPLEYRSCFEMAYRTALEWRLGGQFYHISNGSVGWKNPGTESFVLFLAIPL